MIARTSLGINHRVSRSFYDVGLLDAPADVQATSGSGLALTNFSACVDSSFSFATHEVA